MSTGDARPAHGYESVDSQPDPRSWIRALDTIGAHPFFTAYKKRIRELLRPGPGSRYLEIGAGTGADAREMARVFGCDVVALDISRAMVSEARRRGTSNVLIGTASRLPFAASRFDGCWADRVCQHLESPGATIREAARVTRTGGRVVVIDPDSSTQVLDFPDRNLAEAVLRFRTESGLRQGSLAGRMTEIFAEAGLKEIQREVRTLTVLDPESLDHVFGLRTWAGSAAAAGYIAWEDVSRWERLYDEMVAAGRFRWQVESVLTWGMASSSETGKRPPTSGPPGS